MSEYKIDMDTFVKGMDGFIKCYESIADSAMIINNEFSKNIYKTRDYVINKINKNTNFEKATEFNQTAEVEIIKPETHNVFEEQSAMVGLCVNLIAEEFKELQDAVRDQNMTEVRDALADILVVTYGMAYRLGIDADADYDLVHESNMSKFCISEEEAQQTVDKYKSEYASGNSPYDTPSYRQATQNKDRWIVFNESTGKILKNINYKKVTLV